MTVTASTGIRLATMKRMIDECLALDVENRAVHLASLSKSDPRLAEELEAMLAAFDSVLFDCAKTTDVTTSTTEDILGQQIGPFRLLRLLGTGGMGAVYYADRIEGDFEQHVAIKLVRQDGLSSIRTREFVRERQLLARLEHANIARLIDGGISRNGQPWLAMEYVDGTALMQHVSQREIDTHDRLQLWLKVADAIEYAHRSLIVHGDLKPSNVLVSADGMPKLIDFGVARLLAGEGDSASVRGYTPRYAAPEQISGGSLTTTTDVYGLGAVLFELLAGSAAFQDLTGSALQDAVLNQKPPPLRAAAMYKATDGETQAHVRALAANGRSPWFVNLNDELDAIVQRAMAKDPQSRYPSVNAFSDDVKRYLGGLPVKAVAPRATYRLGKFLLRNRIAAAGVFASTLILAAGVVSFVWQASETAERASQLELVSAFQAEMLSRVDPTLAGKQLNEDVTAMFAADIGKLGLSEPERLEKIHAFSTLWPHVSATDAALKVIDNAILKPAALAISEKFHDQPKVEATLRQALADRYRDFGMPEPAYPLQISALEIRRRELGENTPLFLESLNSMAYLESIKGDLDAAERDAKLALSGRRKALGDNHPDTIRSIALTGTILAARSRTEEAEPYYVEALNRSRTVLGDRDAETLANINNNGYLMQITGRLEQAEALYREALEKRRQTLGDDHTDTLNSLNNMAYVLTALGRAEEAEQYAQDALKARRRLYGEFHPTTILAIRNLGATLFVRDRLSEAEPLLKEGWDKSRQVLGERHPETLGAAHNFATLLATIGKFQAAESLFQQILDARLATQGPTHRDTLVSTIAMGTVLVNQGQYAKTLAVLTPTVALEVRKQFAGGNSFRIARFLSSVGRAHAGTGSFSEAEQELLEANTIWLSAANPNPKECLDSTEALVSFYTKWRTHEPSARIEQELRRWQAALDQLKSLPAK